MICPAICPQRSNLKSQESNVNGIYFTTVIFSYLNEAAERRPQNHGYSRPCCDPSVVELRMKRMLGPFEILLTEFEFKHWGATITIAGTVMSMRPNPSKILGQSTLRKYVYVTICTGQLCQARDYVNLTSIHI